MGKKSNKITISGFVLKYIVYILFVLYFLVYAFFIPSFFSAPNLINILNSSGSMILMTIGITCVIAGGNIDCSTGGILYLCCVIALGCTRIDLPVAVTVFVTILGGAACGLINGLIVAGTKMYGMLPTMATAFVFRGIAYSVTAGSANLLPDSWAGVTTCSVLGIPIFLIVCIVVAIVFQVFFNKTVPGRKIFALGSDEKTAGEKGINIFWYKTLVFVLAGALTGGAAVITSSQVLSATNMIGQTSNIYAILAAIIGGASFYGAKGSALGALFGALILSCMSNALVLIKADANMYYVVYAAIILILVVFDAMKRKVAVNRT